MAEPDPNTPQVVDPERVVNLTRLLQIRGPLGVLNVLDTIVPVVNMGDVVTRTITVLQPAFRTSDVFSNGYISNGAPSAILADTGPLAEGIYDILVQATGNTNVSEQRIVVQHRNAADNATLAEWAHNLTIIAQGNNPNLDYALGIEFADNERLRISQVLLGSPGQGLTATIFARRRA